MSWLIGGGVAAAVLLLAAAGWALRRGRGGRIGSPEDAVAAAEAALPGFVAAGAVVGADGLGALAVDGNGRVAAVKRVGRRIAVREVPWRAVRASPAGLVIETGERRMGQVRVAKVDALDVRRLAPHLTRL
jgi:hypothetical protein